MQYYNLKLSVILKKDISSEEAYEKLSNLISYTMLKDNNLKLLHEENKYKNYVFCNLYPIEKDSIYKCNNIYYFDITGTGGTVVLCEEYIPQTMQLDCLGLDVSRWNYEYGGNVEGNALFYDPEKFLVPHL